MTFPLIIFLYIYFAFLVVWAIFSLIGFYHLIRFGGRMFGSWFTGLLYIIGSIAIFYLSFLYLSTIDWQTEVQFFSSLDNIKDLFNSPTILR